MWQFPLLMAGHDERIHNQVAACRVRSAKRMLTKRRTGKGGLADMIPIWLDKPDY